MAKRKTKRHKSWFNSVRKLTMKKPLHFKIGQSFEHDYLTYKIILEVKKDGVHISQVEKSGAA